MGAWMREPLPEGGSIIEHLDGVPWYQAPIPHYWHRCKPQTRGWLMRVESHVEGTYVERCRCGAVRFERGRWTARNERRKNQKKR